MKEEIVIYICWKCGRTIKWISPSAYIPNTHCTHADGSVWIMDAVTKDRLYPKGEK